MVNHQPPRRKRARVGCSHLGSIKQTPPLVAAMYRLMPKLDIEVSLECEVARGVEGILRDELAAIGPYVMDRVEVRSSIKKTPDLNITIELYGGVGQAKFEDSEPPRLRVPIDPLKFMRRPLLAPERKAALHRKYGIADHRVIVAGSISRFDLKSLNDAIQKVFESSEQPTKVLIVPRNSDISCDMHAQRYGLTHSLSYGEDVHPDTAQVVTVNEEGVLFDHYGLADVAIIGSSLDFYGGPVRVQNPLEPALYGCPIISGPTMKDSWNWEAYEGLQHSGLLTQVTNQEELEQALLHIPDEVELESARRLADAFITSKQGAGDAYARMAQEALYS